MSDTSHLPDYSPALAEYLSLRDQIASLSEQLEALKPEVVQAVMTLGGKVRLGRYELSVRNRVSYNYSDYVAAAEAHLSAMKQIEQEKGVAVIKRYTEFPFVRVID